MKNFIAFLLCIAMIMGMTGCKKYEGSKSHANSVETELAEIAILNNGQLPEIYYDVDDGTPRFISGTYTNKRVSSGDDAIASLSDIASLMGIDNPEAEFKLLSEQSYGDYTYYSLQQVYNGIEVYGKNLIVSVNQDGVVSTLSGDYDNIGTVDTKSKISEDDAVSAVLQEFGNNTSVVCEQLVIYTLAEDAPQLAWEVSISNILTDEDYLVGSKFVFVSAETGDIIATQSNTFYESAVGTGRDNNGEKQTFNTWYNIDTNEYVLSDVDRNIDVYNAKNQNIEYHCVIVDEKNDIVCSIQDGKWIMASGEEVSVSVDEGIYTIYDSSGDVLAFNNIIESFYLTTIVDYSEALTTWLNRVEQPTSKTAEWKDNKAVTIISNIEKVYDYYLETFTRKSFNNLGSKIIVVYNNLASGKGDGGKHNSYSINAKDNGVTLLSFGIDNSMSLQVVAHEYTHSVEKTISNMISSGKPGVLKEAYSDIMGCLCSNDTEWIFDKNAINRNIADPSLSKNPDSVDSKYVCTIVDESTTTFEHTNSTIISHAAYLMYKYGVPMETLEQIWYHSLYYLPRNADYDTCRNAVVAAARAQGCTDQEINIIKSAFDEVGVYGNGQNSYLMQSDSDICVYDYDGNKIENYTITATLTNGEGISYFTPDSNGKVNLSLENGSYTIAVESIDNTFNMKKTTVVIDSEKGQEDTLWLYVETTPKATQIIFDHKFTDDYQYEYAIITGKDDSDSEVWSITTDQHAFTDLGSVSEIGISNGVYYYAEDGAIVALNVADGTELWRNNDFGGSATEFVFGDDGTLYLCSYYDGPNFFAVDENGNTLAKIDSFDSNFYWPYELKYVGDTVEVTMEGTPYDYEITFYVKLDDYSYYSDEELLKEINNSNHSADDTGTNPELYESFVQYISNEEEIYYICDDFDNDGTYEAYGITGTFNDGDGLYNDVHIYYISNDGFVTDVNQGNILYGYLGTELLDTGSAKFIVWEVSGGGSGSISYIYGVKNGQPYEPEISRCYMCFGKSLEYMGVSSESAIPDSYIGYRSDFSNGYHQDIPYYFTYDSSSHEFIDEDAF